MIFLLFSWFATQSFASPISDQMKFHVHGEGYLSIVERSPVAGYARFQIPLSTAGLREGKGEDMNKLKDALKALDENLRDMVLFNADLKCQWRDGETKISDLNNGHREIRSDYQFLCKEKWAPSELTLRFKNLYPQLDHLVVFQLRPNLKTGGLERIAKNVFAYGNGTFKLKSGKEDHE